MTFLDENLKNVSKMEGEDVKYFSSFLVDKNYSHLFEVLSGEANAATTWRENSESDEVTGIFTLKAGDAALFLPGEPYLIKFSDNSEISEFVLGK